MNLFHPPPGAQQVQELVRPAAEFWQRRGPEIQYRTEAGIVLTASVAAVIAMALWRLAKWTGPRLAALLLWLGHGLETLFPEGEASVVEPFEVSETKPPAEESPSPAPPRRTRKKPTTKTGPAAGFAHG